jgi:hypothetical protein
MPSKPSGGDRAAVSNEQREAAGSSGAATVAISEADSMPRTRPSPDERHRMIANAAYYCAQARGFAHGFELDDWLRAEADIDAALSERGVPDSTGTKPPA